MSLIVFGCPPEKDYLKLLIKPDGWEPEDETGYAKIVIEDDKEVILHWPDGTWMPLSGDAYAVHVNQSGEINGLAEKTSPADGDVVIIEDSEDGWNKKKVQVGNLPGTDTFIELTDTPSTYTGNAGKVVAVKADESGLEFVEGGGGGDDKDVKVSDNDTTPGFLEQKIVAGTNVSITVLNEGGNEQLEISAAGGGSGSPGGTDKSVQYNQGGSFGGDGDFVWDYSNKRLGLRNASPTSTLDIISPDGATRLQFPISETAQLQELTMTGKDGSTTSFGFRYNGAGETCVRFTRYANTTKNWAIGFSDEDNTFKIKQQWGSLFRNYANTWLAIKETGEVGIGVEAPTEKLQVGTSGDGTRAIANEWATFSDRRIKEVVGKVEGALDTLKRIEAVLFRTKGSKKVKAGFIAQDVADVWKYATGASGNVACIDAMGMIALLVEAVKELAEKVGG